MKRARKRKLRIRTKSEHVTPVGGNVFLDLGFEPEEAARLLAEADRRIDEIHSGIRKNSGRRLNEHEFLLRIDLPNPDDDPSNYIDALHDAGCSDATIGTGQRGRISLDFTRKADTRLDAVISAVAEVRKAIPGASLVEMPVQNEDRIFLTQRETMRLIEIMENPPPRTEKFIQAMDEYQKRKLDDNDTSIDWLPESRARAEMKAKELLADEIIQSTRQASEAANKALAFVDASNKRINALEQKMKETYHEADDILHIEFSDEPIIKDVSWNFDVNIGYGQNGLAEVTILNARKHGYWTPVPAEKMHITELPLEMILAIARRAKLLAAIQAVSAGRTVTGWKDGKLRKYNLVDLIAETAGMPEHFKIDKEWEAMAPVGREIIYDDYEIRNDDELQAAFRRLEKVFHAIKGTQAAAEMERLVTLIEAYENKYFPINPPK